MITDPEVQPVELRTRADPGIVAVDSPSPRLSWRLQSSREAVRQKGYEIEVADSSAFHSAISSGFVAADAPFDAHWPAPELQSREVRWCRVRVWTDKGMTCWSEPLRLEAGLFRPEDWSARPVSPLSNVGRAEPVAAPLLRRSFDLPEGIARARLYVSALGIHETTINGASISADLFEPGWTAHPRRHLYSTYDVTKLLQAGENVIAASIGDGWWRGNLTWMSRRAIYGDTTALIAQLEVDFVDGTRRTIATDTSWRGTTGGLLEADLYDGSTIDLRREPHGWRQPKFDDRHWEAVIALELPERLDARPMRAVELFETFDLSGVPTESSKTLYDCKQNLTGWLRITARGPAGAAVTVRHAEVLDDQGRLYTAALRNARATDRYVLDGSSRFQLEPRFTFHGFRYAEVIADPDVTIDRVEARVITSDLQPTGEFDCSNPLINKLLENIRWSQRGNFLALPTDCPQRDERMGWTGDIQVFAPTACMNSDVHAFLASWLKDVALDQRADGCVPSVVPNVIPDHEFAYGAAGWGDAATLVPWALYEAYGDSQVLRDQFDSMKAWVDWCASRLNADSLWEGDFQLGDWLDPGAPPEAPLRATTSSDYVASAYFSHSAGVLAQAAARLGLQDYASQYSRLSRKVAAATWLRWRDHALTTQAGCAIAIEFGIAPEQERSVVADQLAGLVKATSGRIRTGFLGTPLVLPALTRMGHIDAAYLLLLNEEAPGWLYQVLRGGTTTWERWDAIRPDGSIHPGTMEVGEGSSMMSFNHYAYGAVAAWLYRSLAGIAPVTEKPGYAHIVFAPRPGGDVRFARARLTTPFGPAGIAWRLGEADRLEAELVIPPGATASFDAPPGWEPESSGSDLARLASGSHHITLQKR